MNTIDELRHTNATLKAQITKLTDQVKMLSAWLKMKETHKAALIDQLALEMKERDAVLALNDELKRQLDQATDKMQAYSDYFHEVKRANMEGQQLCACGCGRQVTATRKTGRRQIYYSEACRKRAYRLRKKTVGVRQRRSKTKVIVQPVLRRKRRKTKETKPKSKLGRKRERKARENNA